jgi:nicotinate-nucleotide adenylyltransferase
MASRRVAIYGGTFDPVHNGHLEVARGVLKFFEVDELVFVPACVPPHKRNANITSAFHRFAMLALAAQADQRLLVSTLELDAPDRPYAVETVARMQKDGRRLFFVIGADSWAEITTWHKWTELLRMCDIVVVTRPEYEIAKQPEGANVVDVRGANEQRVAAAVNGDHELKRVFISDLAMVNVSATQIRAAARAFDFEALQKAVPQAVASYIEKHGLYKTE